MIKDVRVGQTSWKKYKRGGREDAKSTRIGPQAVADRTLGIHSSCLSHQPLDRLDPNAACAKTTPLQLAVDRGHEELVGILLTDPRVDPDLTVRRDAGTPLLQAALNDNVEIVQKLLNAGANKISRIVGTSRPAILLKASARSQEELIHERGLFSAKSLGEPRNLLNVTNPKSSLSQLLSQIGKPAL